MNEAVLGLGTNIGDRVQNLKNAVSAVNLLPQTSVAKVSYIYETEPVGFTDQANFLNCALLVETELSPRALLGCCLGIEAAMGRIRQFRNGPRNIDIDLLLYENEKSSDSELTLPHPRMHERLFVLKPLLDLFQNGDALGFSIVIRPDMQESVKYYCNF